jgi:hypothetical protein
VGKAVVVQLEVEVAQLTFLLQLMMLQLLLELVELEFLLEG